MVWLTEEAHMMYMWKQWVKYHLLMLKAKKINHHVLLILILNTWLNAYPQTLHNFQDNDSFTASVLGSEFSPETDSIGHKKLACAIMDSGKPKIYRVDISVPVQRPSGCCRTRKSQWSSLKPVRTRENSLFLGGGSTFCSILTLK